MKQYLPKKSVKKVGTRLRKLTERQGHSWAEMETALGVKKGTIVAYESGFCLPSTSVALRYAKQLNLPLEEIFGKRLAREYKRIEKSREYTSLTHRKERETSEPGRMRIDRKNAGRTLDEIATRINEFWPELRVTKVALSKMELGAQKTPYEVAVAYAHVLGKPLDRYDSEDSSERFDPYQLFRKQKPKPLEVTLERDLDDALKLCSTKEKKMITQIYWEEKTLKYIGDEQKITRERVRQKKEEIITKMREFFRRRGYSINEGIDEE